MSQEEIKVKVQEIESKLQEEAKNKAMEALIKNEKVQIKLKNAAKALLDKGLSSKDIMDITGLSKKEIEQLK